MARQVGMRMVPLSTVESILRRDRKGNRDVYAKLEDIQLEIASSLAPLEDRFRVDLREGASRRPVCLSHTAVSQICALAGVPVRFLDKVPAALGLKLLRCLLEMSEAADSGALLLRLSGGRRPTLRAVLPHGFVRFDDLRVLEEVRSALDGRDVMAARLEIDDDRFFLRLAIGDELNLGTASHRDGAFAGMDIISSETGVGPIELRWLVYRLVCANGMTEVADANSGLRLRQTRMDRGAFVDAVRSTLAEVVGRGRRMLESLAETRSEFLEDPRAEVEEIFRRYRLGSPNGRIGRTVIDEVVQNLSLFGVQRWDICQAFTAVARGLEHRERMRFEDAMGAYVLGTRNVA